MTTALFPGSFDPFHLGHLAVVEWAAAAHDTVVVGLLANPEKRHGMFAPDVRAALISSATAHLANVECTIFDGLTADLARRCGASVIVRSAHKEADVERTLAVFNKFLSGGIPTEFAPNVPATEHISSTLLRQLLVAGDLEAALAMVPEAIRTELRRAERLAPDAPSQAASTPVPGSMAAGRRVRTVRVAVVQDAPVLLDRDASVDRALDLVQRAAAQSAELVVFPEAFLPGYPAWVWGTEPGSARAAELYQALFENAVVVESAFTQILGVAANRHGMYISIGVNEREPVGSSLYSTQLLFGPDRSLVSARRKLVATGAERLVWQTGPASGLRVVETPFGRVGTLVGEDSYLAPAREALYRQGADIYLAPAWGGSELWRATLRHVAREGGVYVVGVNPYVPGDPRVPGAGAHPEPGTGHPAAVADGHSMIVGPTGQVLAGPLRGECGILTLELDANDARVQRRRHDPTAFSGRSDVASIARGSDDGA